MRIALVTAIYPPLNTSGAVLVRDLVYQLAREGHEIVVLFPDPSIQKPIEIESDGAVKVVRIRIGEIRDIGYIRRLTNEILMPFVMKWRLSKSSISVVDFDAIICHAPSIFFAPLIKHLKASSGSKCYLILRDIFPQWALDLGVIKPGLVFHFLDWVAKSQYEVADMIGVQSESNLPFISGLKTASDKPIEVLYNWIAPSTNKGCSLSVKETALAGRKIFVYAGNMGVAQGMDALIDLVQENRNRTDIGFLFIGRGNQFDRICAIKESNSLTNLEIFDEIDSEDIPGLFAQCDFGIVALDKRHKTHNIPGKVMSYLQNGLPIFALLNEGNDLIALIEHYQTGVACVGNSTSAMQEALDQLIQNASSDKYIQQRCRDMAQEVFAPEVATNKIIAGFKMLEEQKFLR